MTETPELSYLSQQIDSTLRSASRLALMGVTEAERRKFDYAATCVRDLSRPLVAQVLWKHIHGIEKDLRTLLHEPNARIKLYVVRNTVPARQRIDEGVTSFRQRPELASLLRGFRLLLVPSEFDADKLSHQAWMSAFLREAVGRDILFNIVFGDLTQHAVHVFADHGGPVGLKYAILDEITANGLMHGPTFNLRLGYKTSGPIREAIAMLNGRGLIRRIEDSNICIPTARGRALLDFTRLLLFQTKTRQTWSSDAVVMLETLGIRSDVFYPNGSVSFEDERSDLGIARLLSAARYCQTQFGRDLLADVNFEAPCFY